MCTEAGGLFSSSSHTFLRAKKSLRAMFFSVTGMFAIRAEREYVIEEDFIKATRKIAENKKLEGKLDYEKI